MRDVAVASVVLWDSDVAGYTGPVEEMNTGTKCVFLRVYPVIGIMITEVDSFVLPIVIQELRD